MAQFIKAPEAEADALEIWAYIAQDNPDAADRLLDRFDKLFRVLASQPLLGKSVEELAPNLRLFSRSQVLGNALVGEAVLHSG